MISLKLKTIIEQLERNARSEGYTTLNESTDGSSDNNTSTVAGQFGPLIIPLIKKIYVESLISQVADVQPLTSPVGKVAALIATYSGEGSSAESNLHPDNSFLIRVADVTGLNVLDVLTASDASTFKIHYIEDKSLLVSRESGIHVPVKTDVFTSVGPLDVDENPTTINRTVTYATKNRASLKKVFKGYTGAAVNGSGRYLGYSYGYDNNSAIKHLGFETRTFNVVTETRKLKSKFSAEQIQELQNVYQENGIEVASESLANEIRQEIDKEFIAYLKFIAKISTSASLDLSRSIAAAPSGALQDVASDIVANMFLAAEQIVKDTKRSRRMFIMVDPITAAFVQTTTFFTSVPESEKNIYRVGNIGNYPLYVDLYAEPDEHYVVVGYRGSQDNDGDSGIIYAPYTSTVLNATDTNFKENLLYLDRHSIVRHPQDTGNTDPNDKWSLTNEGNSDFFKMFTIDYGTTALVNFDDISIGMFS